MITDEIIKMIAVPWTETWHCYDTLRQLLDSNEEFKNILIENILENNITGFSNELWKKLKTQNIRVAGINSFLDVLKDGYNQGYCTVASKQVSYSLNNCYICGGTLPILSGTINCPDGSHTWIEQDDWIIDTTLMLFIKAKVKNKFGYNEENRYNPTVDAIYNSTKKFVNDRSFSR